MPDLDGAASRPAPPYALRSEYSAQSLLFGGETSSSLVLSVGNLAGFNFGTVFAMVRCTKPTLSNHTILSSLEGGGAQQGLAVLVNFGKLYIALSGLSNQSTSLFDIPDEEWVAVCVSKSTGNSIPIFGMKSMSRGAAWVIEEGLGAALMDRVLFPITNPIIGALNDLVSFPLLGSIGAVAVWSNISISAAVMQTLHTRAGVLAANPSSYWDLDKSMLLDNIGTSNEISRANVFSGHRMPGSWSS